MEAEFKARLGYSLIQSAPALFEKNFTFSDGSAPRVRNDLNAVRGELWIEHHIKPMEAWAHSFNYRIRLQPYGEPVTTTPDEIEAASLLDRPETESLFFGDEVDSYLPLPPQTTSPETRGFRSSAAQRSVRPTRKPFRTP